MKQETTLRGGNERDISHAMIEHLLRTMLDEGHHMIDLGGVKITIETLEG